MDDRTSPMLAPPSEAYAIVVGSVYILAEFNQQFDHFQSLRRIVLV